MKDTMVYNSSKVVGNVGTHLQPPRDQPRKRSCTSAKREQSEGRKSMRSERDEFKEDRVEEEDKAKERDMVGADAMVGADNTIETDYVVKALKKLNLERESRTTNYQNKSIGQRVRFYCCLCDQFTGAKGRKCFTCGHVRCDVCHSRKLREWTE